MRTLLITCGCLELSKDGIGDYSFNLGKTISTYTIKVVLVSLNDAYVREFREENKDNLAICRIPRSKKWSEKAHIFKNILETVSPDHISFQYVVYAYHEKGLPWLANRYIVNILKNYETSLMLHEPWIGRSKTDTFPNKIIGLLQRRLIYQLVRNIAPVKVFTSNNTFHKLLKFYGISNEVLPLFSNIPFTENAALLFKNELKNRNTEITKNQLKIVLFGRIPFRWKISSFAKWLGSTKTTIFTVGRSDQQQAVYFKKQITTINSSICVEILGEQTSDIISGILQYADVGLALTPAEIMEKSGVVAAYKEHGLPIISAGINEDFRVLKSEEITPKNYISLNKPLKEQYLNFKKKNPYSGVDSVSRQFLESTTTYHFQKAVFI
ncbi:hypothetical protein [Zunongwangia sp.]|uniref:hypothetical protein n=1 Tax=Zunongwangia sp. TaxID=1965325 RepID=UPI003AA86881